MTLRMIIALYSLAFGVALGPAGATGRDSPDSIANIVRDEQCAVRIERNANGASYCVSVRRQKAGEKIFGKSSRLPIDKRHEYHLVSRARFAIP